MKKRRHETAHILFTPVLMQRERERERERVGGGVEGHRARGRGGLR